MDAVKDGGPAFAHDPGGPYPQQTSGISVRDYFAAAALQGLLASPIGETGEPATVALAGPLGQFIADSLAIVSYRVADAMQKERDRG